MSTNAINLVILTGIVGWVKIKYNANNMPFVNFTIKQPKYQYDKGEIVGKSYIPYFVYCFDQQVWSERTLKEGVEVSMQGRLETYTTEKTNRIGFNVIAERIVIMSKRDEES